MTGEPSFSGHMDNNAASMQHLLMLRDHEGRWGGPGLICEAVFQRHDREAAHLE